MKMILASVVVVVAFITAVLLAAADTPATPAAINTLIARLGSDNFAEREEAAKALDAIGEPALAELKKSRRKQ
jgi:hypothetical protein